MATSQSIPETLKKLNYGIYIVTSLKSADELVTRSHDWVSAGTVSWAMQVSMEPELVAICLKKGSNLRETVQRSHNFAIHILSEEERGLIKEFAKPADFSDDEVNGHHFERGTSGAPILKEGLGVIECRVVEEIILPGDHVIFVGEPVAADLRRPEAQSIAIEETPYTYGG